MLLNERTMEEEYQSVNLRHQATDVIYNNVKITLSWRDRILVLFGNPIYLESKVYTKIAATPLVATNRVYIEPIKTKNNKELGTEFDYKIIWGSETVCKTYGSIGAKFFKT